MKLPDRNGTQFCLVGRWKINSSNVHSFIVRQKYEQMVDRDRQRRHIRHIPFGAAILKSITYKYLHVCMKCRCFFFLHECIQLHAKHILLSSSPRMNPNRSNTVCCLSKKSQPKTNLIPCFAIESLLLSDKAKQFQLIPLLASAHLHLVTCHNDIASMVFASVY